MTTKTSLPKYPVYKDSGAVRLAGILTLEQKNEGLILDILKI